jgi:hypothetical protein
MYIINTDTDSYFNENFPTTSISQLNLNNAYKIFNNPAQLQKFNIWLANHPNIHYLVLNDRDVNIDVGIRNFININHTIKYLGINIDDYQDFNNLTQIVTERNFNIEKLMFHRDIAVPHYMYNKLERAGVEIGWIV